MQAIILAAGMGKRLGELTRDNTKCMIKVNGQTLIERMLRILDKKGLDRIVIVIGYKGEALREYIEKLGIKTRVVYISNPIYDKTNNIYSLSLADDYLVSDDTLLFESDLIFEEEIVDMLIGDERESLAVADKFESMMDGTCMILDGQDNIVDFISGKSIVFSQKDAYYKTVNIYKFSKHFSANTYVPFLEAYRKAMGQNEYYEYVIKLIAMLGTNELKAMRLSGQKWYEIDDIQDLDMAETLFADAPRDRYDRISERYGGFWRYPKMLDFCYLVNPYFPPDRMVQEIRANADVLIRSYPSGMRVNSMLAARNFGISQEHVVVGNGASELIKALAEAADLGTVGMIRPTFEEYPNRIDAKNHVFYHPSNDDFSYSASDLIGFFSENKVDSLILINPDNPTGNYIPRSDVLALVEWARGRGIRIIIDESFADFADENGGASLISEEALSLYDGMCVIKSISKSYGVPGIRLGVLASADAGLISELKRKVSIWNINSLAEFFMQICAKYEPDYRLSLQSLKKSRRQLFGLLEGVPFLRPIPSQANFICCELLQGAKSEKLASDLLDEGVLIKCLTSKISNGKEYIRVSVRTEEENERLASALLESAPRANLDNSRWAEVWGGRKVDEKRLEEAKDEFSVYRELKRLDGYDVQVGDQDAYYKAFYDAALGVYEKNLAGMESVYEVGCGSGANLVLYRNRGKRVGGIDYSERLAGVAKKLVPESDITIDEAINVAEDLKYDAVMSEGVFAYFPGVEYGREVLRRMYEKARRQVILLEIFDKDLEEECNEHRRALESDYDEKYAGLGKTFYPRQMFADFAKEHGCRIEFSEVKNDYYWNSRYLFNCFIYK